MKDRILERELWIYDDGYLKRDVYYRDLLYSKHITFKGDTMICAGTIFLLKYEYFGRLKVGYPNSDKTTIYEPKGGSNFGEC